MQSYADFFKGRKITVVGLGLLGGIHDIRFLAESGAQLIITDLKSEEELRPSLDALKDFPNIRYTLGRHEFSDFENRDLIIQPPAIKDALPYVAHAKSFGIPITMWAALFSRFARGMGATIVGITGTRGKTTTTALIAEILRAAGKKVFVGGNMQGVPTLAQLPEVVPGSVAVFELDSWKTQGFREEGMSPDIGVFTTFYPDHLNYYGGDLSAYLADKAEIFLHQRPGDTLVLGEQCADTVLGAYGEAMVGKTVIARAAEVPAGWVLKIPGEHNRANVSCAIEAARALGVDDAVIKKACEDFRGVDGRLQFLREAQSVKIYNDTTATTPEATIAGLRALDPAGAKNIVLIMGGADKNLDMSALAPEAEAHCKKVLLLAGTGTDSLKLKTQNSKLVSDAPVFDSLALALEAALAAATTGGIVLFSPAFASFGMFKNEYDRGAQFVELVAQL